MKIEIEEMTNQDRYAWKANITLFEADGSEKERYAHQAHTKKILYAWIDEKIAMIVSNNIKSKKYKKINDVKRGKSCTV